MFYFVYMLWYKTNLAYRAPLPPPHTPPPPPSPPPPPGQLFMGVKSFIRPPIYRCEARPTCLGFCRSFMFLFCLVFAMFCARLFICALWSPAGKGLTSWLSFVVSSVSLSLSHWYPGSGVVLDCIDS